MLFDERTHAHLREPLARLNAEGVSIGTSSWKYPGWCGQVYTEANYFTRSKFSEAKFERECLAEYGGVFPTVCVDAGYYTFPSVKYLEGLCSQVPEGFKFGFKVSDAITIKTYPNIPRFGDKAGKLNEHFLDADLFRAAFLSSCDRFKDKIGVLIFEFSHFHPSDFAHGRDFMNQLDGFLAKLPKSFAYAVEIRNSTFLHPEYFAMLGSHGVAHVFNSWTRMPGVEEQIELEGSFTTDFTVARLLLRPGRAYEQAVKAFSPYKSIQDPNETVRDAALKLVMRSLGKKRPSFIFVNNRLEGNAVMTIAAILELIRREGQSSEGDKA